MANPGDELVDGQGGRLVFRQTAGSTGGALLEMNVWYKPNSSPPPEHYHPFQEEHFQVISGTFQTTIDGQEKSYQTGESFTVPPGVPHAMYNSGTEVGQLLWQTRPALNTEVFFETLWGLARDGKVNEQGVPNLLQVAVIGQAYNQEFRLAKPSYSILKVLFALLGPLGRLVGYKSRYPQYSGDEDQDS